MSNIQSTERPHTEAPIEGKDPIVRFKNISKSFGDLQVLNGVDFDLYPGERVAIIGPSGSGKTTMARLLMTLEEPTDGFIEVDGRQLWHKEVNGNFKKADEKHLHEVRGDIGMVFQHFHLFPHMTVLKNLMEAPIKVKGMSKAKAREEALAMLEKVGMAGFADQYPARLSGGQQQRVAIARALVMHPKVMLFDEPTSALDPETVGEVLEVIKEIAKDREMAMLLITHEMSFARDIADRIAFFDEGKIQEEGPPSQLLNEPKTERLGEFLHRFGIDGKGHNV
ncbi:ectoine/hydroxyectoine ABC transporter ATP-binding protein EhuA [Marininema halotolerans]|uniref:Polar amino acid transport system ATP-binding protein n=1 Tax=Marininema halotolerans TaxID=1155944 RepID=A0A1I6U8K1_9BACL|nr:ectoine/hydroxyectoine ABC transporter ATP-binding protein EhuA [Marininema halotolerans]SFS97742.1 polar amino acid transport system ATP-binding protein [Marininema halotolerans]